MQVSPSFSRLTVNMVDHVISVMLNSRPISTATTNTCDNSKDTTDVTRSLDVTVGGICVLYAVCITTGYLVSYWNRPFFPEWCSDGVLDDSTTYDTMVRIAGSWAGVAQTFKVVADMYGWTHIVLLSDDDTARICWNGAAPFEEVFGHSET